MRTPVRGYFSDYGWFNVHIKSITSEKYKILWSDGETMVCDYTKTKGLVEHHKKSVRKFEKVEKNVKFEKGFEEIERPKKWVKVETPN